MLLKEFKPLPIFVDTQRGTSLSSKITEIIAFFVTIVSKFVLMEEILSFKRLEKVDFYFHDRGSKCKF